MPVQSTLKRIESSPDGEQRVKDIAAAPSGERIAEAVLAVLDDLYKEEDRINGLLHPPGVFSKATPEQRAMIVADKIFEESERGGGVTDDFFDRLLGSLILYKLCVGYVPDTEPLDSLVEVCMEILDLLVLKNTSYGDSALNPVRHFSNAGPVEQIYIRLEDKVNRLQRGQDFPGDNDVDDIIGYLILLRVAKGMHGDA